MQYLNPIVVPKNPDIDIVFVHGLNPKGSPNHARDTWTNEGGIFWPETLIRQELPSARVLLFAYNSSILSNASSAHVASHARTLCDRLMNRRREAQEVHRPLIFIAHSLGGLLVKQALVEARTDPLYRCLKVSTCGLVFFATPHRGGEGAGVAKAAADICSAFTGQPRNKLLESLKSRSLITELSSDQFRHQLNDYDVLSFIERRKMPVKLHALLPAKNIFIVDETSAKLGAARENFQDVDRNHSDICKYSGLDDHAYEGVGPNLKAMAERARQREIQCEHTQGATRRESLLEDISQVWQDATPRCLLLSGLGGAGKTELSIALVEKLSLQGYVLWLRASNDQILEQDLITAAEELRHELLRFDASSDPAAAEARRTSTFYFSPVHVTELVTILKRWLKAQPDGAQRKLLVLDDLDGLHQEHHEKYSMFFSGDAVDLIYTARDPSMADSSMLWEALSFDVPSLQVNDAVKMLELFERHNSSTQKRLDKSPVGVQLSPHNDDVKGAQMTDVATCLGGLPAAVTMGSHYMKDNLHSRWNPDSYAKFLDLWAQEDGKRNILQSHRATLKYRHSLLASFEVSLRRLRRNIAHLSSHDTLEECCLVLLQLFSAINMEHISRYDLAELRIGLRAALSHLQDRPAISEDPVMEQLLKDLETTLDQCLTEMVKVSLLTERPSDGTLLLNNVTKVCALIVVPETVSLEKKAAIEDSVREITEHWKPKKVVLKAGKPDNSSPDDLQHRGSPEHSP